MPNHAMNLPFRSGIKGCFETTKSYSDLIKLKLKVLFSTEPNSRIMELNYGAGLKKFLFEPNDSLTEGRIRKHIYSKVKAYIPEINLTNEDITITMDEHAIYISLQILINSEIQTVKMRVEK